MPLQPPRVLQVAKAGNSPDECEDASRVSYSVRTDTAWIAITDGASESAFARNWARILVDSYVANPFDPSGLSASGLTEWVDSCALEWSDFIPWDRLPWHGQAKTRAGSLSALLALAIDLSPDSSGGFPWRAAAVGDCCLFVVREDSLHLAFPMDSPDQFNNTPSLICSNPANNGGLWGHVVQLQGELRPGDTAILASDALAAWFLQESGSGGRPWETLASLTQKEWEDWVNGKRQAREMRNDDTTLMLVPVS